MKWPTRGLTLLLEDHESFLLYAVANSAGNLRGGAIDLTRTITGFCSPLV